MTSTTSSSESRFPVFEDGDVELRLSQKPEDRYVLHSECLIANSPYFKASLIDRWAVKEKPTGAIKWRYELRFRKECALGLLERTPTAPGTAPGAPEGKGQSRVTTNECPTAVVQCAIEAHKQYLRILCDQPFNVFEDMKDPTVFSIRCLLLVADTYNSIPVVGPKIHLYVQHLEMYGVAPLCAERPQDLLDLAIKLRRRWLFNEVVCRLVGDPTRDDKEILRTLDGHESLPLILRKRKELRQMMKKVDYDLLTIMPNSSFFYRPNNLAKALGVARFREDMVNRMILWTDDKSWKHYPSKYREIPEIAKNRRSGIFDGFIDDINKTWNTSKITTDATTVYQACFQVATRTIAPLLETFVREYPWSKDAKPHTQDMNEGFTCIDVSDDELPWKHSEL